MKKENRKQIKNEKFAQRLRALRRERNMTQTQLAEKIGLKRSSVSNWESGERFPGRAAIEYMSRLFGVSADYLYGTSDHRYKIDTRDYFELDLTKLNNEGIKLIKDLYSVIVNSDNYRNK